MIRIMDSESGSVKHQVKAQGEDHDHRAVTVEAHIDAQIGRRSVNMLGQDGFPSLPFKFHFHNASACNPRYRFASPSPDRWRSKPNGCSSYTYIAESYFQNAFDISMDPSLDLPKLSTCTTCTFTEDLSNYWTAVVYFRHKNGTFERVHQIPEELVGPANGGMTLYYIQPPGASKVTAFPKGFRMIVGDPLLRSFNSSSPESRNLHFRCLNKGFGNPDEGNGGPVAEPGTDTYGFPERKCEGEIVWDTKRFNHLWEEGEPQPFVFSHGDPTGYGQHADYIFGWEGDSLQRAMDTCKSYGGPCPTLKTQSVASINRCVQKNRVREAVDGALPALPGCNPIQPGPRPAVPYPVKDCNATKDYAPL
ncbi:hypothetical protein CC1G_15646 [Coprinopsis cinerea okayama7|uniref:DUF1996 domain-containing protein n=1 Tax=Coprinopsis cinerea (strain Okayama-7 / 130 / ATCC MYA-4618 / FGSC 9003) TaxID=240176 RepID=D6RQA7_COPC7|nr:hypothetical protein CC1G_15646 [Coprinopsis cinerea okayama7\|eukprot:XP_002910217.1 hypothetical protein CC1G_15646 [Coprinopsis cinerea okayama7\